MVYVFVLGFLLGMFVGVLTFIVYGIYKLSLIDEKIKTQAELVEEIAKKRGEADAKIAGFRDRLTKVQVMTKQQLEMLGQLDAPSKNALHSKWKNSLNGEIKKIEEEKLEILRSILKDGYDPTLPVLNNTTQERENIKLSEFLKRQGISTESPEATQTPLQSEEIEPGVKKVGKFIVYTGGNDGTTH